MKRKNDPFSGIKITPQSGKQSFVFDYRPSIKIRFTLNPTTSAGYLARGTIGLLDPQTTYPVGCGATGNDLKPLCCNGLLV